MKSSGLLTDTTKTVHTGPCRLLGVSFSVNVTKSETITVYNALAATANTEVAHGRACGGTAATGGGHTFEKRFSRDDNMFCETGLHVVISAASCGSYIIYFEPM